MESYAESLFAEAQLPADEPTSPILLARRHGVQVEWARLPMPYAFTRAQNIPEVHRILVNDTFAAPEARVACAAAFAHLRALDHDPQALALAILLPRAALLKHAPGFRFDENEIANYFCVPPHVVALRIYMHRRALPLQSATRMRAAVAVNDSEHLAASFSR